MAACAGAGSLAIDNDTAGGKRVPAPALNGDGNVAAVVPLGAVTAVDTVACAIADEPARVCITVWYVGDTALDMQAARAAGAACEDQGASVGGACALPVSIGFGGVGSCSALMSTADVCGIAIAVRTAIP